MAATHTFNLPVGLIDSLCYVESKHDITKIHKDDGTSDSLGVCQVKWTTAHDLGFNGTPEQLMNPQTNIYYAAKYLSHQIARYHGDITKGVIAYNRGHAGRLTVTSYSSKVFKQWQSQRETVYADN